MSEFVVPAAQTLFQKLDVRKKAHEDGLSNIPSTESTEPSGKETQIINIYDQSLREARNKIEDSLANLKDERRKNDIALLQREMEALPQTFSDNVAALRAGKEAELRKIATDWCEADASLRTFQHKNLLEDRPPRHLESRLLHYSILVAAVVAESILNANFFGQASQLGILGGAALALAISTANLFLAVFIGTRGIQYSFHVDPTKRKLGMAAASLWFVITLGVNLGAAHYRVHINLDPFTAAIEAANTLFSTPFSIPDLESLLLFLVGQLFAIGFVIKDLHYNDIYPGYSDYWRTNEAAEAKYMHARDVMINEVFSLLTKAEHKADKYFEMAAMAIQRYRALITESKSLQSKYTEVASSAEDQCNHLINDYRQINTKARGENRPPPPAYFKKRVVLSEKDTKPRTMGLKDDEARLIEMENAMSGFRDRLVEVKEKLSNLRAPTVESTKQWLDSISAEAFGHPQRPKVTKEIGG